jgi:hypothetical protein
MSNCNCDWLPFQLKEAIIKCDTDKTKTSFGKLEVFLSYSQKLASICSKPSFELCKCFKKFQAYQFGKLKREKNRNFSKTDMIRIMFSIFIGRSHDLGDLKDYSCWSEMFQGCEKKDFKNDFFKVAVEALNNASKRLSDFYYYYYFLLFFFFFIVLDLNQKSIIKIDLVKEINNDIHIDDDDDDECDQSSGEKSIGKDTYYWFIVNKIQILTL